MEIGASCQKIQKKEFRAGGTASTKALGWEEVGEKRIRNKDGEAELNDGWRCINTHNAARMQAHTRSVSQQVLLGIFHFECFHHFLCINSPVCGAARHPEQLSEVSVFIPLKS